MLDDATVQDLLRHWDEGWNAGDLPDGTVKHGADSMRVNAAGQVVEWQCHYSRDSVAEHEESR